LAAVALLATGLFSSSRGYAEEPESQQQPAFDQNSGEPAPASSIWKGAFRDSLNLLMIEHTTRIVFQEKTRRELGGPFFEDYKRSLKIPTTWNDGDSWGVNYIGHPIHGAAAGFIWLGHENVSHDPTLGFSKRYWTSRGRATAWALAYSLQFEFGPLSEASIGNVGLHPNTTGWVDHVVTPTGALGIMVVEDMLDRWLIRGIESHTDNRAARTVARVLFNPARTLANVSQGAAPSYRIGRPLR
jgi:hypothetical protein